MQEKRYLLKYCHGKDEVAACSNEANITIY